MNEVSNAWDVVKAHAQPFKPLFCYTPEPLTADEMMKLFDISTVNKVQMPGP